MAIQAGKQNDDTWNSEVRWLWKIRKETAGFFPE